MSADLPFTRDRANLIARAEQVATACRLFRVEAHGSYHFCADCQQSEAAHIIRALLDADDDNALRLERDDYRAAVVEAHQVLDGAGVPAAGICTDPDCCTKQLGHRIRAALSQTPPASDQQGPTVINEDDGDVTIDFDYANDRVVSIRLGEESSGLSALVDGVSYSLCPLDQVPPEVLALLRTEAKE